MIHKLIAASVIATLPIVAIAHGHGHDANDDAIKARQGFFVMLSTNMGILSAMAKGEAEYDETKAAKSAANIETLSKYDLPIHFIEGSSKADVENTAALPEIWEDFDDFQAKYAAFGEAATGASEAVKGGRENVGPVVAKLGGTCKACHDSYRSK